MFTGLVEELGRLVERRGDRIRLGAELVLSDASIGDSIAVNGCCLTVVETGPGWWEADVSDETRRRTALGQLTPGAPVNLERSVRADQRLGGHVVQGHVDGIGEVLAPPPELRVRLPADLLRYCVEKGSITVDGVSLTIAAIDDDVVTIAVIPHTAAVTTLGRAEPGRPVNLEVDVMAKYVERLLAPHLPGAMEA